MLTAVAVAPSIASATSAPSAPRSVRATFAAGTVHVHWARPATSGAGSITRYVVSSHPARRRCVTRATSCALKGLKAGSSYTFTVVAKGAGGSSANSRPSNRVKIPKPGAAFLKAASALNDRLATEQATIDDDINNGATSAKLHKDLAKLTTAYATFSSTLKRESWPANAQSDVAGLAATVKTLSSDWIAAYEANASTAGNLFNTLESDTVLEREADAKVRADLSLTQIITGPITTTPSAVALGAAQAVHDFSGDTLSVTVTSVVDPATAGTGSGGPDNGYRFVAVQMNLTDTGLGSVEGDVNYSTSVVGSDGTTYHADFGTVAECTNFSYGLFDLPGNDSASGCVVFELPTGVSATTIKFTLAPGWLDTGEWND